MTEINKLVEAMEKLGAQIGIETDNYGQIVIYTGLKYKSNDRRDTSVELMAEEDFE